MAATVSDTDTIVDLEDREASRGRNRTADVVTNLIVLIISLLVLLPFYEVVIVAFGNTPGDLLPHAFNIVAFKFILTQSGAIKSFVTSVGIVVIGTVFSLFMTTLTAYPLSRKRLFGRKIFTSIAVFTMFFGGGLVPWYLVIKSLGLLNTYAVMIIPSAINTFYMILMLSFFREFPDTLEEAAKMDGASDWVIVLRIVLPTSLPVMVTVGLFYAVDRWNDWFTPLLMINDSSKWPLQAFTYNLLQNATQFTANAVQSEKSSIMASHIQILPDGLKMAVIVVGVIPIMCIYPFLQKYFAKGVMIGSIKG